MRSIDAVEGYNKKLPQAAFAGAGGGDRRSGQKQDEYPVLLGRILFRSPPWKRQGPAGEGCAND